ncbi:YbhB/YbcL family Raf kinase inhibitor-like protein [Microvirga roseola]|uniref:YbhB/YbcL family Raf kinase inhibitor-like protein n=1 Tax=Microvirga roseola TaxID=2883126 RepID=UPI0022A8AB1C|nr:YbhB/YbcL family Raf kinase inhibitor-like protein [Microvirga roseola]
MPTDPAIPLPEGAKQGVNSRGSTGNFGMKPPAPDGAHSYHFQVFALDKTLDLKPGATREDLLKAMQGHVLAKGEVVGTNDHQPN